MKRKTKDLSHDDGHNLNLMKKSVFGKFMKRDYLVICYKSIWENTFTTSVVSLNFDDLGSILVRHEVSHLWEAFIHGSLQDRDNFIILSDSGASVLSFD